MADPVTPNINLVKPIVGDPAGEDLWGQKLNDNFDIIDDVVDDLDARVALVEVNIASQAEAEAGSDNTKFMTSLRTKQQIDARRASQAEAEAGTDTSKLMTPQRTAQAIAALSNSVPAGTLLWASGNAALPGTVKANGASLSRTTYAALWAYAQASGNLAATQGGKTKGQYGPGDGSTTFTIPDLRGEFIRAWDDGAGIDTGRTIGSSQAQAIQAHTHTSVSNGATVLNASAGGLAAGGSVGADNGQNTTGSTGGTETRPRNVAYLACIKF